MLDASTDRLEGRTVKTTDGDKIGELKQLYVDSEDGRTPTFATVAGGLFGTKHHFVPLSEARLEGDDLLVPYSESQIKDAPGVDEDAELTTEEEDQLYAHYGLGSGATGTTGGADLDDDRAMTTTGTTGTRDFDDDSRRGGDVDQRTGARDTSGTNTDDAMTLSEERLNVGVQRRETGRARLRKFITEEQVTETVPVTREEVHVEREPITDANRDQAYSGGDLTEEEVEVTLHEERPVVEKEVVATERVRLDKDVETSQQQVSDTVRKEEVEVDGADTASGTTGARDRDDRDRDDRV